MASELNQDMLHKAGIGSFFRPSQLEQMGIPYHRLRQLEADKEVERVGWGLYRLADAEPTERYSLASVCAQVPNSIVCLLSARQVHGDCCAAQAPGMDRHPAQGQATPCRRDRDSASPLQRGGPELRRAGHEV